MRFRIASTFSASLGAPKLVAANEIRELLDRSDEEVEGHGFSAAFLRSEWGNVVDAWQLETWEDYRDVARLGRKTRLAEKQRAVLWSILSRVRAALAGLGVSGRSVVGWIAGFGGTDSVIRGVALPERGPPLRRR